LKSKELKVKRNVLVERIKKSWIYVSPLKMECWEVINN